MDVIRRAVRRMADGADFSDAVTDELGLDAGCEHSVTFDRRAAKGAGVRLLT
ncbi:type II toxin-antitoxin system VapC family toxin [Haloactinopolyspora alba]|uniref:type II toxin-antitoxin system VapC family toxin n=1 Tax=Haloactinopolyspora alba TaxID=648780 RepID=UPI0011B25E81|nr:type II toxin-antitoxin system VapC family toxin [Haloactinopolyspora alba]